jgi:hypothetical protein
MSDHFKHAPMISLTVSQCDYVAGNRRPGTSVRGSTCASSLATGESDVNDIQTIVNRYIDMWNETDPRRREALVAEVFADHGGYTDPLASVRGRPAIDQLVGAAQAQFAGLSFRLGSPVDAHHDQARFTWHLAAPESTEPVAIGFDVAVLSDGQFRDVYGFIDKMP